MNAIYGIKKNQFQMFLADGTRIPVTSLEIPFHTVTQVKTKEKDGYEALQVGIGQRKRQDVNKAIGGKLREIGLDFVPKFFREIRLSNAENIALKEPLKVKDILQPGDAVDVIGVSKGKGFAGVVKRHHFRGGPRTHGQSDRERAPGSIGQTTTPGRVYRGKRMAGRMGQERVTVKNLTVVSVSESEVVVKGLVPGGKGSLLLIKKVGQTKNFVSPFETVQSTAARSA
jgi:large subunit ribosomal protein L3